MAIAIGEASGAWGLVRGALDAVAAAHHTSGPPTALTERLVPGAGGSDVDAYFEGLSRGEVHVDAGFATEVFAAANDGDEVARTIAGACGAQHGRDLAGVVRRLGMADDTFDVVLAGGVHTAANPVFSSVRPGGPRRRRRGTTAHTRGSAGGRCGAVGHRVGRCGRARSARHGDPRRNHRGGVVTGAAALAGLCPQPRWCSLLDDGAPPPSPTTLRRTVSGCVVER